MSVSLDVKPLIEGMTPGFLVAGDSAYPISKTLITPYSVPESEGNFLQENAQYFEHWKCKKKCYYNMKDLNVRIGMYTN